MKKILILSFALILFSVNEISAKPTIEVNFGFFYSSLRNYGEWIEIDRDIYAWRPIHVSSFWKPYSRGRWVWSSYGWYWDSYEPFGWAVYHYGRWYYDDYYGWIWIPDYEWGPAWVEWRYNDDYIGWAPLPPYASFHISFGIRFSIGWTASYHWWNFVPYRRFCDNRLDYYILDNRRVERIYGKTKYRNNYYFDRDRIINGGVDKDFIERRAGYRIAEREIRTVNDRTEFEKYRRDDGERVLVYRPSERETDRYNSVDKFEIKRGERVSTLERDKISTPSVSRNDGKNIKKTREYNFGSRNNTNDRELYRDGNENRSRDRELEDSRNSNNPSRNFEYPRSSRNPNENRFENRTPRNENENRRENDRRIEPRNDRTFERPNFRIENNSSRNESRGNIERGSRSRESNRSTERRR